MSAPMCFCNRRLAPGTMADWPQWDSKGARNCGSGSNPMHRSSFDCASAARQLELHKPRYEAADVDRFPAPSRDDLKGREPMRSSLLGFLLLQVCTTSPRQLVARHDNRCNRTECPRYAQRLASSLQQDKDLKADASKKSRPHILYVVALGCGRGIWLSILLVLEGRGGAHS